MENNWILKVIPLIEVHGVRLNRRYEELAAVLSVIN